MRERWGVSVSVCQPPEQMHCSYLTSQICSQLWRLCVVEYGARQGNAHCVVSSCRKGLHLKNKFYHNIRHISRGNMYTLEHYISPEGICILWNITYLQREHVYFGTLHISRGNMYTLEHYISPEGICILWNITYLQREYVYFGTLHISRGNMYTLEHYISPEGICILWNITYQVNFYNFTFSNIQYRVGFK